MVSVPFWGSCSEIHLYVFGQREKIMFPSPFGVRVLKYEEAQIQPHVRLAFPSPFGVRVLKCGILSMTQASPKFPSPFGVRVLKCNVFNYQGTRPFLRFRPLSGFVF